MTQPIQTCLFYSQDFRLFVMCQYIWFKQYKGNKLSLSAAKIIIKHSFRRTPTLGTFIKLYKKTHIWYLKHSITKKVLTRIVLDMLLTLWQIYTVGSWLGQQSRTDQSKKEGNRSFVNLNESTSSCVGEKESTPVPVLGVCRCY